MDDVIDGMLTRWLVRRPAVAMARKRGSDSEGTFSQMQITLNNLSVVHSLIDRFVLDTYN
jgi:hypothetical protein